MKFKTILLAGIVAVPSFALSQVIQETYEGFPAGTGAGSGTATATDFTINYDSTAPQATVVSDAGTKLPGTADDVYIQWGGDAFDWWQFDAASPLTLPASTLQGSVALRPDSLAAAEDDNQIDVFTIDTTAGSWSPIYGMVVHSSAGSGGLDTLRTANSELGNADISEAAFDPADTGNNWLGEWRVLAFRATFTGTNDTEKIWVIETDGTTTLAVDRTGLAAATPVPTVQRFGAGGLTTFAGPQGTSDVQISFDNMTLYLDTYADDDAFLDAVRTANGIPTTASVSAWELYSH